jgi:HTH-type transcriptional regulator/antitoxin HigA
MAVYSTSRQQLYSNNAIPAGEILKDELVARGIKQKDFANDIGMSATQLNEILAGKRGISAEMAIILEKALGINASFWNNLQATYDLDIARINIETQKKAENVTTWSLIKQNVNIAYLKKYEDLDNDMSSNIQKIKDIFNVDSLEAIIQQKNNSFFAMFRKSEKLENDKINLITWVRYIQYLAKSKEVATYDGTKKDIILAEIKNIIFENINTFENTEKCLAKYGIKFFVQPKPEKVNVDAVAFWTNQNPTIVMTNRHKRIDNFAFNIFHELGHIFLHFKNQDDFIIDFEDPEEDYREREANVFAANTLIDEKEWQSFTESHNVFNDKNVIQFAEKINTLPAIVRGRLCKEGYLSYRTFTNISFYIA